MDAIFSVVVGVLTLTFMEIILGIDNIIFIAIIANKLPKADQPKARRIGLMLALVVRVILLLGITQLKVLDITVFDIPIEDPESHASSTGIRYRDLIFMAGGIFLLIKSTLEIHEKVAHKEKEITAKAANTMSKIIMQIVMIDIVFSFDSILTAVALVPPEQVSIMIAAVVVSMIVMMFFSGPVSNFINKQPTLQILALSFLILIGFMLIVEGLHHHVPKSYLYFAVAFSVVIELINMKMRKNSKG